MSKAKVTPAKIHDITLEQFREFWPQSEDGKLCARLLQRYLFSRLVGTAAKNDANALSAQGEAAADKVIAQFVKDFSMLDTEPVRPPERTPMKTLHRFAPTQPESTPSEKKT